MGTIAVFDRELHARVATYFFFSHTSYDDLFIVRSLLTINCSCFVHMAHDDSCLALGKFLLLVGGSRVPNGITSGGNKVRVGSRKPSRDLLYFPFMIDKIPRHIITYCVLIRRG